MREFVPVFVAHLLSCRVYPLYAEVFSFNVASLHCAMHSTWLSQILLNSLYLFQLRYKYLLSSSADLIADVTLDYIKLCDLTVNPKHSGS